MKNGKRIVIAIVLIILSLSVMGGCNKGSKYLPDEQSDDEHLVMQGFWNSGDVQFEIVLSVENDMNENIPVRVKYGTSEKREWAFAVAELDVHGTYYETDRYGEIYDIGSDRTEYLFGDKYTVFKKEHFWFKNYPALKRKKTVAEKQWTILGEDTPVLKSREVYRYGNEMTFDMPKEYLSEESGTIYFEFYLFTPKSISNLSINGLNLTYEKEGDIVRFKKGRKSRGMICER